MPFKVTISFESDKERPYLAALELSEAIAHGQCTYYVVKELKQNGASFGVDLSREEFEDDDATEPNTDAVWPVTE